MTDLKEITPAIIFVIMVVILSSFFIVSNNDLHYNYGFNYQKGINETNIPITPMLVNESQNNTEQQQEESSHIWDIITEVALVIGGTLLIATGIGAGFGAILILGAIGHLIVTSELGAKIVEAIPFIKSLMDGFSYIGTVLVSFWNVLTWSPDFLNGIPLIGTIIFVPLTIYFFLFVIRFIRGQ